MTTFSQIIQLRNQGKTQEDIALALGISRRSVIRYLQNGNIPVYSRKTKSNRLDPMSGFYEIAEKQLETCPSLLLDDLFYFLTEKGYQGSLRTLQRKTLSLRNKLKKKEVYFQRQPTPGEIMEGDFTELYVLIENKKRKVYLWVTSLPFSNTLFANGYYHPSFESFADGSVRAFEEFGGVAKKYRLDNMSPVVTKVLKGKDRTVTQKYAEFQNHYGFAQDFCNPARGNEKGNVEANNKHLKKRILSQISLHKLSFTSLEAFNTFVWKICKEHNAKCEEKRLKENLAELPPKAFKCFRTEVVSINKYSTFSFGNTGHMYSAPSEYIGLSLEARVFPEKVDVVFGGEIVATHKRLFGPRGTVSINIEHILNGLIKKPGAMRDWKHRQVLFERPVWKSFYKTLIDAKKSDKDYLSCLKLINTYGKDLVTTAMEISLEQDRAPEAKTLLSILSSEFENIINISPVKTNLVQYDEFLKGEEIREPSSES